MQRERISIPKIVLYIVVALLLYVLQSSWFGMWSIRGYHLDLMPALVAAAALLDGPAEGVIVGVAVGLFYDLGFVGIDGLYPLFFILFGLVAGAMSRLTLSGTYISMLLMTACPPPASTPLIAIFKAAVVLGQSTIRLGSWA